MKIRAAGIRKCDEFERTRTRLQPLNTCSAANSWPISVLKTDTNSYKGQQTHKRKLSSAKSHTHRAEARISSNFCLEITSKMLPCTPKTSAALRIHNRFQFWKLIPIATRGSKHTRESCPVQNLTPIVLGRESVQFLPWNHVQNVAMYSQGGNSPPKKLINFNLKAFFSFNKHAQPLSCTPTCGNRLHGGHSEWKSANSPTP